MENDEALTPTKAAQVAGVDRTTIYRWVWSGNLPSQKTITGVTVILRSDLAKTIERAAASDAARFAKALAEEKQVLDKLRATQPHRRHHRRRGGGG